MKNQPDWFGAAFAWAITALVWGTSAMSAGGLNLEEPLLWLPLLLALAWTGGFIGLRQLKKMHKEEYERLEEPEFFGTSAQKKTWRFRAYLFGFRFLDLDDPIVTAGFSAFVILTVLCLVLFAAKIFGA